MSDTKLDGDLFLKRVQKIFNAWDVSSRKMAAWYLYLVLTPTFFLGS